MSSTTITRSKEEENFLNVVFMLSKHSIQALRYIIDREISPVRLQSEVKNKWIQIKGRLSQTQQKILNPPQGIIYTFLLEKKTSIVSVVQPLLHYSIISVQELYAHLYK